MYKNTFYNETIAPVIADSTIVGNSLNGQNASGVGVMLAWDR